MQAVAAELPGYAGKFRCLLERRVYDVSPVVRAIFGPRE